MSSALIFFWAVPTICPRPIAKYYSETLEIHSDENNFKCEHCLG